MGAVAGINNYDFQKSDSFVEKIQKKLMDSDNVVSLINITNFRMFLANVQLNFVEELERDTNNMIMLLEDELDRR